MNYTQHIHEVTHQHSRIQHVGTPTLNSSQTCTKQKYQMRFFASFQLFLCEQEEQRDVITSNKEVMLLPTLLHLRLFNY